MASTKGAAQSPPSDNDAGERPVRKQLKETSIDSTTTSSGHRKRSFDESRDDDTADTTNHGSDTGESRRKRSRENSPKDSEHVGTQTVSSLFSNPAPANAVPSDPTKEDALQPEPVDFPNFDWIAQLEARESELAKRSRELEVTALALEERELQLLTGEEDLKRREKWFDQCIDRLEERELAVEAREEVVGARETVLYARLAALVTD